MFVVIDWSLGTLRCDAASASFQHGNEEMLTKACMANVWQPHLPMLAINVHTCMQAIADFNVNVTFLKIRLAMSIDEVVETISL